MHMKKVYIERSDGLTAGLFTYLGYLLVEDYEQADLVVFTGGSDVSPHLYGAARHHSTFCHPLRDEREAAVFMECSRLKIPMVGICRGAQFLNVMSGGKMYQDVTGHLGDHEIIDQETGEVIRVTSTHHQMMMPSNDATIIAISTKIDSNRIWMEGDVVRRDTSNTGIEVVLYEHTKCLCFQPHPEFNSKFHPEYLRMVRYFHDLLITHLGV